MGVLPLEFSKGENGTTLGLKGDEIYFIEGIRDLKPGATLQLTALSGGRKVGFRVKVRIENNAELNYYRNGGVLPYVLKRVT